MVLIMKKNMPCGFFFPKYPTSEYPPACLWDEQAKEAVQ